MNRCNVTGTEDGELYDFYINQDFGYAGGALDSATFEFVLCEDEFKKFMSVGVEYIDKKIGDNYTYQYDKEFTSEQIYDLISTFQIPPKGYFNQGWLQYTEAEEQWLWDNQDKDETQILYSDVVSVKRAVELSEVLLHNK